MTFKILSYTTMISDDFIIPLLKINGKNLCHNC